MPRLCVREHLALITAIAVFTYVMSAPAGAATHIVGLAELQQDLNQSRQRRASDLADLERVLSLPAAKDALASARLDLPQVETAIASLNDVELARLAARARAIEQDVQGGLIVGLLALIGLIVVVIVVISIVKAND